MLPVSHKLFSSLRHWCRLMMATHSSILAWKIPRTEEPGRLQSMESQSRTRLSDFTFFLFFMMLALLNQSKTRGLYHVCSDQNALNLPCLSAFTCFRFHQQVHQQSYCFLNKLQTLLPRGLCTYMFPSSL